MSGETVSIAITGAGGAGVMTASQMLLDAVAKEGLYGLMGRSSGPQIRGGEVAAFLRLGTRTVECLDDRFDIMVALDWLNVERFSAEIPLDAKSLVLCDADAGEPPARIVASGARLVALPLQETVNSLPGGRMNMVGLGLVSALLGVGADTIVAVVTKSLGKRGQAVLDAGIAGVNAGAALIDGIDTSVYRLEARAIATERWNISGNEAAGLGAVRGGVRFVAAYPITPATEILEWLAPNLEKVGGVLVQAEDELASINMIIGGSFGGTPSLTATSGPGLALMTEAIGLAVASETPIVVIDVMRGGPSTGIPTKSEQSDLNIALYGLHGDAPHIVTAANSISDCLFTAQWSVHLAEQLQVPAIVLTDQLLGQSRAIVDRPADIAFLGKREMASGALDTYQRYAVTTSGVSPMAIPGTPGGEYVADGLEHAVSGRPSSGAEDHTTQLDKRARKIEEFDYGQHWAEIAGDGPLAVLTWGSCAGPVREACARAEAMGLRIRLICLRLLAPAQVDALEAALEGVERVLVVEQSHSKQFYRYLRAHYDLPRDVRVLSRPGPLPIRAGEVLEHLQSWS
ncbi:MAG: 2-oxoacid:acceptor oxidoreductase subunit alpha [Rhodospirillales bacterium]|nr:2-oxoacid:acceptor oxidoreductase subunit alpha [Rhodospirillales bacterium]